MTDQTRERHIREGQIRDAKFWIMHRLKMKVYDRVEELTFSDVELEDGFMDLNVRVSLDRESVVGIFSEEVADQIEGEILK